MRSSRPSPPRASAFASSPSPSFPGAALPRRCSIAAGSARRISSGRCSRWPAPARPRLGGPASRAQALDRAAALVYHGSVWQGSVVSIHVAPEASALMRSVAEVRAAPGRGLEGDRYFTRLGFYSPRPGYGGRGVTPIEGEVLEALAHGAVNAEGQRLRVKLTPAGHPRQPPAARGAPKPTVHL